MVSRVEQHSSRQLISDSRALITAAHELLSHARQSLARQRYLRIVCAWCQETIRFERAAGTARGQISHSICFPCFADVFQELDPVNTFPPVATKTDPAPRTPYLRLVL
jgi:hypothetical protein